MKCTCDKKYLVLFSLCFRESALQRQYTENSKHIFPDIKLCGLVQIPTF